jgi:hypothetical protein
MKWGRIPGRPVVRVVERWCLEHDSTITAFEEMVGLSDSALNHIARGRSEWIHFDIADRVVTFIDFMLWHTDPELSQIYQTFDFSSLDFHRPPSLEADELPLLDCLNNRLAAAVMGVGTKAVQARRAALREEVAA